MKNKNSKIFGSIIVLSILLTGLSTVSATSGPELEITEIEGLRQGNPLGVSATVTNVGDEDALDVFVTIHVEGGFIIHRRYADVYVDRLCPGDSARIRLIPVGYGFGRLFPQPTIIVKARNDGFSDITESVSVNIFGIYVMIL